MWPLRAPRDAIGIDVVHVRTTALSRGISRRAIAPMHTRTAGAQAFPWDPTAARKLCEHFSERATRPRFGSYVGRSTAVSSRSAALPAVSGDLSAPLIEMDDRCAGPRLSKSFLRYRVDRVRPQLAELCCLRHSLAICCEARLIRSARHGPQRWACRCTGRSRLPPSRRTMF